MDRETPDFDTERYTEACEEVSNNYAYCFSCGDVVMVDSTCLQVEDGQACPQVPLTVDLSRWQREQGETTL